MCSLGTFTKNKQENCLCCKVSLNFPYRAMSRNYMSKFDELRKGDYLWSNNHEWKAVFQVAFFNRGRKKCKKKRNLTQHKWRKLVILYLWKMSMCVFKHLTWPAGWRQLCDLWLETDVVVWHGWSKGCSPSLHAGWLQLCHVQAWQQDDVADQDPSIWRL